MEQMPKVEAFLDRISSNRSWLIRLPLVSSIHMRCSLPVFGKDIWHPWPEYSSAMVSGSESPVYGQH